MAQPTYEKQFRQFFSTNGDGTGTVNAIGDYSSSPVDFYVQPPANKIYMIGTVLIAISDDAPIYHNTYGAIFGGLSNGVSIYVQQNGVEVDAFQGWRFKKNVDWYGVGSNVELSSFSGAVTMAVAFRTFVDTGGYVKLDGSLGDKVIFRLNDNFTPLYQQTFVMRGIYFDI